MTIKALYSSLRQITNIEEDKVEKTLAEYKREALVEQGRDQFKLLIEKGLNVPVALL